MKVNFESFYSNVMMYQRDKSLLWYLLDAFCSYQLIWHHLCEALMYNWNLESFIATFMIVFLKIWQLRVKIFLKQNHEEKLIQVLKKYGPQGILRNPLKNHLRNLLDQTFQFGWPSEQRTHRNVFLTSTATQFAHYYIKLMVAYTM